LVYDGYGSSNHNLLFEFRPVHGPV
jgi:hypothetical protein